MLYITTRSKAEVYTPARTLQMDRGADGGMFVPFRAPVMEPQEVLDLGKNNPSPNMADYLNMGFGTELSEWDVELALGRNGFDLHTMGRRLTVWELWHNRDGKFSATVDAIARQIKPEGVVFTQNTEWVVLSVRIAVLIGLFTKLLSDGTVTLDNPVNFALCSGDFSQVMALWEARKMGLPIRDIVIGCNENSAPWDLIVRGQLDFDASVVHTSTPEADFAVPDGMERLIYVACGHEEVMNYCWSMSEGSIYNPEEDIWNTIRRGMSASVVSQSRLDIAIPSVYRSMQYVLDPYAAIAYGALSDYRAKTGDTAHTLLIAEYSPLTSARTVAQAMRISVDELRRMVR